jgi:hypothetical protein
VRVSKPSPGVVLIVVLGMAGLALAGCCESPEQMKILQDERAKAAAQKAAAQAAPSKGDVAMSEDTSDAPAADAPAPGKLFMVGNDAEVFGGGKPTKVTLAAASRIDELWTYHWNGGAGAPAGTITMTAADGTVYGPWQATAFNKVYWIAKPGVELPAGTYTVTDSDPKTWAQNPQSGGRGHTWATGEAAK